VRDTAHTVIPVPATRAIITDLKALGGFQVEIRFQDEATPSSAAIPYGDNGVTAQRACHYRADGVLSPMELCYPEKKTREQILRDTPLCSFNQTIAPENNMLIKGDNLPVLQTLLQNHRLGGSVDLIYIDPPFATNTTFTIGEKRVSTISKSASDDVAYIDTLRGVELVEFIRERLIIARELLSDVGSLYLHIDYKIGHYIKIIMDEIFGVENFRNDITRIKCNPKNFERTAYGNIKDMILFYSKTKNIIWNDPKIAFNSADKKKLFNKIDEKGRAYTTIPLHAPGETKQGATGAAFKGISPPVGRHWRCAPQELEELDAAHRIEWSSRGNPRKIIYADEKDGKKMQDIWAFKDYQHPRYPTEKNLVLLKTIVAASSREQSLVLDFFCGSGTTLIAARELNRRWIGVDQSEKAIAITKEKLSHASTALSFNNEYSYIEVT
jgi:adenine-specific DNA-methyltransferase